MKTVVFDLDGTLADTAGDLIVAANLVLAKAGHGGELLGPGDARLAGHGGRALLRAGFTRSGMAIGDGMDAAIARSYPAFLEAYAADIAVHTRLYPGAEGALKSLRDQGYRTAVCTNKPVGLAVTLLDHLALAPLFDAVIGAGSLAVVKPDPAPFFAAVAAAGGAKTAALLVGDTVTDRDTARAAGVPLVLVSFGPVGAAVADLAPDAVLSHFDDLPGLVSRFLF